MLPIIIFPSRTQLQIRLSHSFTVVSIVPWAIAASSRMQLWVSGFLAAVKWTSCMVSYCVVVPYVLCHALSVVGKSWNLRAVNVFYSHGLHLRITHKLLFVCHSIQPIYNNVFITVVHFRFTHAPPHFQHNSSFMRCSPVRSLSFFCI